MHKLTKGRKQPPVVILQKAIFYHVFILCLWLRIIRRSDKGVLFMKFPSQILFNDINHDYRAAILKKNSLWLLPFYMAVSYKENVNSSLHDTQMYILVKDS